MKKLLITAFVLLLIGFTSLALALEGSETSGAKTSSGSICTGICFLTGLQVTTNGSADATVILYDNPSVASGTVLAKMVVFGGLLVDYRSWAVPPVANAGIYATVSGTGAGYTVEFYKK